MTQRNRENAVAGCPRESEPAGWVRRADPPRGVYTDKQGPGRTRRDKAGVGKSQNAFKKHALLIPPEPKASFPYPCQNNLFPQARALPGIFKRAPAVLTRLP
jgi:hypothetical protein